MNFSDVYLRKFSQDRHAGLASAVRRLERNTFFKKKLLEKKEEFSNPTLAGLEGWWVPGKVVVSRLESGWSIARAPTLPNMSGNWQIYTKYVDGQRLSNIFPNWQNFCSRRDIWNETCLFVPTRLRLRL